ncbi:hypothetical protein PCE1_001783 [Barthelona sp. PCE]
MSTVLLHSVPQRKSVKSALLRALRRFGEVKEVLWVSNNGRVVFESEEAAVKVCSSPKFRFKIDKNRSCTINVSLSSGITSFLSTSGAKSEVSSKSGQLSIPQPQQNTHTPLPTPHLSVISHTSPYQTPLLSSFDDKSKVSCVHPCSKNGLMRSIRLQRFSNVFYDFKVPLNSGTTVIIAERGSGKSYLAKLLSLIQCSYQRLSETEGAHDYDIPRTENLCVEKKSSIELNFDGNTHMVFIRNKESHLNYCFYVNNGFYSTDNQYPLLCIVDLEDGLILPVEYKRNHKISFDGGYGRIIRFLIAVLMQNDEAYGAFLELINLFYRNFEGFEHNIEDEEDSILRMYPMFKDRKGKAKRDVELFDAEMTFKRLVLLIVPALTLKYDIFCINCGFRGMSSDEYTTFCDVINHLQQRCSKQFLYITNCEQALQIFPKYDCRLMYCSKNRTKIVDLGVLPYFEFFGEFDLRALQLDFYFNVLRSRSLIIVETETDRSMLLTLFKKCDFSQSFFKRFFFVTLDSLIGDNIPDLDCLSIGNVKCPIYHSFISHFLERVSALSGSQLKAFVFCGHGGRMVHEVKLFEDKVANLQPNTAFSLKYLFYNRYGVACEVLNQDAIIEYCVSKYSDRFQTSEELCSAFVEMSPRFYPHLLNIFVYTQLLRATMERKMVNTHDLFQQVSHSIQGLPIDKCLTLIPFEIGWGIISTVLKERFGVYIDSGEILASFTQKNISQCLLQLFKSLIPQNER